MAKTTNKVDTEVPIDLLMVCRRLSWKTLPYKTSLPVHLFFKFSLILSKITIVSLILYHIVVSMAIINIVSICIVEFMCIRNPYAHAGIDISKIMVPIVTKAKIAGDI